MFGYYYQPLISDMCNTTNPMTGINISMDAARWDIQARSMFNMVPNNFASCSYTPYAGGGYDFNAIFNATLSQMNQQNMIQYGMPLFGENGCLNMPSFGGLNMPTINTTGVNNGGNNTVTGNEQQKKYTKLINLMKGLANFAELSPSKKEELLSAANRPQGKTIEEKYDYLLDIYKSVDKDIRKEYLESTASLSPDGTNTSFSVRLHNAGYEIVDEDLDDKIPDLKSVIDDLSNENPSVDNQDAIIGQLLLEKPGYDILDVVSSWNSKYGKDGRLLNTFAKKYNALNESAKETAKSSGLDPILEQMIKKARNTRTGLSDASKDKINKAIEPLEKAKKNPNLKKIDDNLCKAFDNLYIILRQATIEKIRNEAKDYYGEIDPEVFNDELFKAETEKDLKAEGFTDEQIKKGEVSVRSSSSTDDVDETEGAGEVDETEDTATAEAEAKKQKVQDFVDSDKVEKFEYKGKTYYEETVKTGGRDYKRVFRVNSNGELEVWQNAKRQGNSVKKIDNSADTSFVAADVEAIESEIESAIEETTNLEYNGKQVARKLCEWTTSDDDDYIQLQLEKCDKSNIMSFMAGIYSNSSFDHKGCEGFIEKLDDDTNIDFEVKKKFIETFIEAAIDAGLDKSDSLIKELKDLVANGRGGFFGSNGFNRTYTGVSALFGFGTNYNEKIDEVMFDIYKKIQGEN